MTSKERRILQAIMEKAFRKVLDEDLIGTAEDELIMPMAIIDKIEDFLGHPISFMGIS